MVTDKTGCLSNIESPCVRNCCLREDDICLGCFRHIEEIKAWTRFNDSEKEAVLMQCQYRKNNDNLQSS